MDNQDFLHQRWVKQPTIVAREIAGELILVPVQRTASDIQSIYTTNEVGSYIWAHMDGERTGGQILDAVVAEFEVDREQAEADLKEFLEQAEQLGAIKAR